MAHFDHGTHCAHIWETRSVNRTITALNKCVGALGAQMQFVLTGTIMEGTTIEDIFAGYDVPPPPIDQTVGEDMAGDYTMWFDNKLV